MSVESLLNNIKRGREGKNIGISFGLPEIDNVLYGLQKKYLYVVGADTSGGKTSYALDIFIYNTFKNKGDYNLNFLYFSFEMASDVLFAKLLSRYIYDEFDKIITYKDILSLNEKISDDDFYYVEKSLSWLNSLSKNLTIYDKALSPNAIYAVTKEWLKRFGNFVEINEHKEEYVPFNPGDYKIILIDHVGLISGQGSKKEKIDLTVDYMIGFRNKCNITGILIQQMNRNSKSMERRLNGYELYQLDDFKDTSATTDGADVVLALYYPYREKVAVCEHYPIKNILKKRFRLLQILKNRYGHADVNKGLGFYGEIGMFIELPKPAEIINYEKYLSLSYKEIEEIIESESTENTSLFTL